MIKCTIVQFAKYATKNMPTILFLSGSLTLLEHYEKEQPAQFNEYSWKRKGEDLENQMTLKQSFTGQPNRHELQKSKKCYFPFHDTNDRIVGLRCAARNLTVRKRARIFYL